MTDSLQMNNQGFLVIRRINWFTDGQTEVVGQRIPSVPYSHYDILLRYRGIEGELWPDAIDVDTKNGLGAREYYRDICSYYEKISAQYRPCDMIYCQIVGLSTHSLLAQYKFYGYDYGYVYHEANNYSVVFNEVIYGQYDPMRNVASHLNSHLLFSNFDDVLQLDSLRTQLSDNGYDLENDEVCVGIAVYDASLSIDQ